MTVPYLAELPEELPTHPAWTCRGANHVRGDRNGLEVAILPAGAHGRADCYALGAGSNGVRGILDVGTEDSAGRGVARAFIEDSTADAEMRIRA